MYIVTGGAGFIGSVIVQRLNDAGKKDIVIVDDLQESEKWKNLRGKQYTTYINKEEFYNVLHNSDHFLSDQSITAVIHMGACSDTTEQDMDYLWINNIDFSKRLCRFALERKARFVYASSAATYGNGDQGYKDDHDSLEELLPLNRYGYSKHVFDLWLKENDLLESVAGVKFFNVYGPNEYHKGFMTSVPYNAYHQVQETNKIKLFRSYRSDYKNGEQKRDFIYVKDCADVVLWLAKEKQVNGIFNLGTGTARTWNDLASAVFGALDKEVKIEYIDMPDHLRGQYQYFTEADMSKLTEANCPITFKTLEEGVKDYVQNYLQKDYPFC